MIELTNETKAAIIKAEIELWNNSQYQAMLRIRVARKIGNAEGVKIGEEYMERCERALMELETALAELLAPQKEEEPNEVG
jgi:hypothetical protein